MCYTFNLRMERKMKWVSDLITGLCVALGAIVLTVNRYRQDQQVLFLLKGTQISFALSYVK